MISNNDTNIMYNKITEESSQVYSRLFIRFQKNDKTKNIDKILNVGKTSAGSIQQKCNAYSETSSFKNFKISGNFQSEKPIWRHDIDAQFQKF